MTNITPTLRSTVIKSVGQSDQEILTSIAKLYLLEGEWFELDPCFSTGRIYQGLSEPMMKSDLNPQRPDIYQADCGSLPLEDNSISSIVFDPPFMWGNHGQQKNYKLTKRFTMFKSYTEMESMYKKSLLEFFRILRKKGVLVFKCQDYTDSYTTLTHCLVWQWALEAGFKVEDLFILLGQGGRIFNSNLIQRHPRKFHCYYFIFRK